MTRTTTDYAVTPKAGDRFVVRATSYQAAAEIAARRLYGRRATAVRTTGHPTLSGQFRAYLPMTDGSLNSTGDPFHVS